MNLDPNRFDVPSKPPRELMRDGAWLVPVEDRPPNWERLGLDEPSQAVQDSWAQPVAAAIAEPAAVPRGRTAGKWDETVAKAAGLKDGESMSVPLPLGGHEAVFKSGLRSILGVRKETSRGLWSIKGSGVAITLTRAGTRPDPVFAAAGPQEEAAPELSAPIGQLAEPTKEPAVIAPPTAIQIHLSAEKELLEAVLHLCGTLPGDEVDESLGHQVETLAETVIVEREARAECVQVIERVTGETDRIGGLTSALLLQITDRRRLERALYRSAFLLRQAGQVAESDRVAQHLPSALRDILQHPTPAAAPAQTTGENA